MTASAPPDGLRVTGLTVRFGGLVAVDDVSLHVPRGRVTGLIGPNGAGKTTTFNACSGLNRPSAGTVSIDGVDVSGMPPHARARRGLGRTFQRMELYDTLTVAENVGLGREAGLVGSTPWRLLWAGRTESRDVRARAGRAMEICGITAFADRLPAGLSTGQRRSVELARVIAGGFPLLLLDEPSSGLDGEETASFGRVLRRLVEEEDTGILVVEHDMSLVMSTCDYLYVLDFGKPIFEGTTTAVVASDVVRAAYLGSTEIDGEPAEVAG